MRSAIALSCVASILGGASCGSSAFSCEDDQSCRGDGQGFCEADGACSFADPSCPSGRRYGELGPANVAGECVPNTGGTGSDSVGAGTSSGDVDTQDDGPDPRTTTGDTTNADADTTGVLTTDPTDSASATQTTTTTTSTTTSTSNDGTGDDGDPYGQCEDDDECAPTGLCEPSGALPMTCSQPCESALDCPPPSNGDATPACVVEADGAMWCALRCDGNGVDCPDGMECNDWRPRDVGDVCTWF